MTSRKLRSHGVSEALVEVSVKSSRAYARIGRTIEVLVRVSSVWHLPL